MFLPVLGWGFNQPEYFHLTSTTFYSIGIKLVKLMSIISSLTTLLHVCHDLIEWSFLLFSTLPCIFPTPLLLFRLCLCLECLLTLSDLFNYRTSVCIEPMYRTYTYSSAVMQTFSIKSAIRSVPKIHHRPPFHFWIWYSLWSLSPCITFCHYVLRDPPLSNTC